MSAGNIRRTRLREEGHEPRVVAPRLRDEIITHCKEDPDCPEAKVDVSHLGFDVAGQRERVANDDKERRHTRAIWNELRRRPNETGVGATAASFVVVGG